MTLVELLNETRYMQYLCAIIATMSTACTAMHLTWGSPALPQLTSEDSPTGTTVAPGEASWIVSSFLMGTIPGCIVAAWLVEKFGRKATLLMSAVPLTVPWIGIVFAKSVVLICVLRFIGGVGLALVTTGASMYNGEIAEKDIRGKLGTTFNILKLTGGLYVLCVGPFIPYKTLAISCTAFPIIFVILFCFMPESPYYLVKSGKIDAARVNLIRLSSNDTTPKTIEDRLEEIESTVQYDMKNRSTLWELFSKKEYRKSLIVMAGIKTLQQLSGITAIESYMQTIIKSSESSISPEHSSIIAGVIQIPAAVLAGALVDKMGRKPLMIISAVGCGIALIGEGLYFYIQDVLKADVSSISWLPTTALLLYLLMNPLGVFTLPWILLGELFATNIKGIAVSVSTFYGSILAFLVTKFFQPISTKWGLHVTFWIFAGVCILGALFSFFVQPETKGKTFAEIQEKLNRGRKDRNRAQLI